MKTIINTTDKDISVTIFGKDYMLPANGEVELLPEAAEYWIKLHEFLKIKATKAKEEEAPTIVEDVKIKKSVTKK